MGREETIKDPVVQDGQAGRIVRQVEILRLLVVVEAKSLASSNDSLGLVRDGHAVDFVQRAVESLNRGRCSQIPNSKHSRNVC